MKWTETNLSDINFGQFWSTKMSNRNQSILKIFRPDRYTPLIKIAYLKAKVEKLQNETFKKLTYLSYINP